MGIKDSNIAELLKKIKGLDVDLPDLAPDEPFISQEQIEEIGKLTQHIFPDDKITVLGKWQAAHVIYKLKEAEMLCFMAEENEEEQSKHKLLKVVIMVCVLIFFALLIASYIIKKH